jgi:glycosyltransferase involved in cell wall biosynthesis
LNNPLVSIIIPTFNRLSLLHEAVASVFRQTYSPFELIVVDDDSSDHTSTWLENEEIRCIRLSHSGKPGHVRNQGVLESSGDVIAFLDSDDLWKPEKLEMQIEFLDKHPNLPLCHTREEWVRGDRMVSQSSQKHARSGDVFADAVKKCVIGPSTVVMKRSIFFDSNMFDPELEIAEDYDLWLRVCSKYSVGYLDRPLVIKRAGHSDQLSEKYGQIEIFRIKCLQKNIDNQWFDDDKRNIALTELIRKCLIYSKGCRKRNKIPESDHYLALSERYRSEM